MSKKYPIDTDTFFCETKLFKKKTLNIGLMEENIKVLKISTY